MNVLNGDRVVLADTTDTQIFVTDCQITAGVYPNKVSHLVTVAVGTVKFGIGTISANAGALAVGAKAIIECAPGKLRAKATTNSDSFDITTVL
jgi:hypothetical protein